MTLRFGLTATLVLAGSMTLLAQSHDRTHPQGQPHGPHDAIDPQLHAAMHSLVGTWTGTLRSANGLSVLFTATWDAQAEISVRDQWTRLLAPSDAVGRTIATGDRPPTMSRLLDDARGSSR